MTLVQFRDVSAYIIRQAGGTIISDIREETIEDLKAHGVDTLESLEFLGPVPVSIRTRVWVIESAIGFTGYIIGEAIETTVI